MKSCCRASTLLDVQAHARAKYLDVEALINIKYESILSATFVVDTLECLWHDKRQWREYKFSFEGADSVLHSRSFSSAWSPVCSLSIYETAEQWASKIIKHLEELST